MAPVDRRLRLYAALVRRQTQSMARGEAEVCKLQARQVPDNGLTNYILGKALAGTEIRDRTIDSPAGEVGVRIYRAASAGPGVRPLIVYFHGGGFVFGEPRLGDWLCSNVAATVNAVVVSADYRLAPLHRFPAAIDDCYAVLSWAAANSADLGAGGLVGVMGESAGGNISAVICLLARDLGGPAISHQVLLYPVTDMRMSTPRAITDGPFLSELEMRAYNRYYLGDADGQDFRASPLLAADHHGLPPALIQVAEHDPLREDGIWYAAALRAADVPVRLTEYVGMPHGYLNFPGLCRVAPQALAEICTEQAAALSQPEPAAATAPTDSQR